MCPPDRLAGAQFAVYIRRMPWYIIAPTINSKTNFDFVPRAKRAEDKRPPPLPRLSLSPSLGHFFQIFSLTSNSCFEYIYVYIRERAEVRVGTLERNSFPIIWFEFGFWKNSRDSKERKNRGNRKQLVLSDSDLVFGKTLKTRKKDEMEGTGSSWCCLIRIWFLEKLSRFEKEKRWTKQEAADAVWFRFGFWKNSRDSKERRDGGNRKQLVLSDSNLVFGKTLETRRWRRPGTESS